MTQGFTDSENYLLNLARKSFLKLWSWPNLFRDQKASGGVDGKELCDLLVVFGNDVLIFSDKHCKFPDTEDIQLAWSRWYKRAIQKSAEQALGAQRWLESYPNRVFVDPSCRTKLPIDIPIKDVRYHLIVVAHGSGKACSQFFNDTASLMINTRIVGDAHTQTKNQVSPFSVGVVNPGGLFIHVLDDSSLDTLLNYLDTVGDFVDYLSARERFLKSRTVIAVGEEEMLGFYLSKIEDDRRGFFVPSNIDAVLIDRGHWHDFLSSDSYKAKKTADKISYMWDEMINAVTESVLNGRSFFETDRSINDQEKCLRILASERRTNRRALAQSVLAIVRRANMEHLSARLIAGNESTESKTAFVFLSLKFTSEIELTTYRKDRISWLEKYCMVAKMLLPSAKQVVGVATEHGDFRGNRSEDLVLLDSDLWTKDDQEEAIRLREEEGIFKNVSKRSGKINEFPICEVKKQTLKNRKNSSCYCGSGKQYKNCHGR
jgi:hypothetical protein